MSKCFKHAEFESTGMSTVGIKCHSALHSPLCRKLVRCQNYCSIYITLISNYTEEGVEGVHVAILMPMKTTNKKTFLTVTMTLFTSNNTSIC